MAYVNNNSLFPFITYGVCISTETVLKFKALKKPAQLAVINSLEKVCEEAF